jgi:hypothetical protein
MLIVGPEFWTVHTHTACIEQEELEKLPFEKTIVLFCKTQTKERVLILVLFRHMVKKSQGNRKKEKRSGGVSDNLQSIDLITYMRTYRSHRHTYGLKLAS